jgi:hypothetical protein
LGMANATRYIKDLQVGKAYVGMVFGVLSLLNVLFRTGIKFPAVTIMRNDR